MQKGPRGVREGQDTQPRSRWEPGKEPEREGRRAGRGRRREAGGRTRRAHTETRTLPPPTVTAARSPGTTASRPLPPAPRALSRCRRAGAAVGAGVAAPPAACPERSRTAQGECCPLRLGSGGAGQADAAQQSWTGSTLLGQPEAAVAELSGGRSGGTRRPLRDSARSGSSGATAGREGSSRQLLLGGTGFVLLQLLAALRDAPCRGGRSSALPWSVTDGRAPLVPREGPLGGGSGAGGRSTRSVSGAFVSLCF